MSEQPELSKHDSGSRYCTLLQRSMSVRAPTEWIQQNEIKLKEMYNIWRTLVSNPSSFTDFCLYMERNRHGCK